MLQEVSELQRTTRFSYDNQDLPLHRQGPGVLRPVAHRTSRCYPELDYPAFANLFLFNALNLERTQDDAGRVDYELPNFNYATTDAEGSSGCRLRRRQLPHRHPELRVQLRVARRSSRTATG